MTPPLETLRLTLLPLELNDAEQIQALFGNWEVVQYLNDRVPWPYPAGAAHAYYRDFALPAIERGDEWHWTLRLKDAPGTIIGAIGLFRSQASNRGFWLAPAWQRQGLMLEAVEAVTDYWFNTLGFDQLTVSKATDNVGSVRLSQKTGMRLISRHTQGFVGGILPSETWTISREEWQRHKALSKP